MDQLGTTTGTQDSLDAEKNADTAEQPVNSVSK
jgi:hypothetical protein